MGNANKIFTVLCGIPGSGKSTYANKMIEMGGGRYIVISRDRVRYDMLKDVLNNPKYYFSREDEVYNEFIRRIQMALDSQEYYGVFADATHLTRKSRRRLLNLLEIPSNYMIRGCYFSVPLDECLRRNGQREGWQKVPEEHLLSMSRRFVPPSTGEGFDIITKMDENGRIVSDEN